MRDVLRILECPVCQDVMAPPVYMCATGHSICNVCKPRLTECPLCKEKLSGARNFTVEQIISSSKHECIYKADGCKATAKGELIGEHIKACRFRPRPCPLHLFDACEEDLKYTDVLQHLKSKHKLDEKASLSGEAEIRFSLDEYLQSGLKYLQIYQHSYILTSYGKTFLVCMLNCQHDLHFGILLIGDEADDRRHSGEITLKLEESREVRWIFPIVSIYNRTVMNYILEESGCTGMYSKQNIYHLCSTRAELKVAFKIRSVSATIPTPQGISWVHCSNGSVPDGAFSCGANGYVIRAEHKGAVIPGVLLPSKRFACVIPFDGSVQRKIEYEVLVSSASSVAWISGIPYNAIPGGRSLEGELLHIRIGADHGSIGAVYPGRGFLNAVNKQEIMCTYTTCNKLTMRNGLHFPP